MTLAWAGGYWEAQEQTLPALGSVSGHVRAVTIVRTLPRSRMPLLEPKPMTANGADWNTHEYHQMAGVMCLGGNTLVMACWHVLFGSHDPSLTEKNHKPFDFNGRLFNPLLHLLV